tara:strand:- start:96 stop:1556 length:1461 start_codon:yes stop_codon:yes gene_type:complete
MLKSENSKKLILSLAILTLPFLEFLKNNIKEIDIIIGINFYVLFISIAVILIIFAYLLKSIFKKINFYESLLIIVTINWILFKHNLLNLFIKDIFKFNIIGRELSSESSLIILVILLFITSILIYKKNEFFKRFLYIFFLISFSYNLSQIVIQDKGTQISHSGDNDKIYFPDKFKNEKQNIYFFILDGMQPIDGFEKNYDVSLQNYLKEFKEQDYNYFYNTVNLYDNTTHGMSAIFYLDEIFTKDRKLKDKTKILFPTLLRKNFKSDLIYNLENLGYDFKWIGNFFAYCPKFNLRYCLNKDQNKLIDTYLYINFLRQTPIIQIVINFGHIFNFDFNKNFFFKLNDGMGRLVKYLDKHRDEINKPSFYFVHHMSPHWPYITDTDCSYKSFPGKKNIEGYKSAYFCTLKKISETIEFIEKNDPNSFVVFQSDHNWIMSKTTDEKRLIFNLIKSKNNCKNKSNINFNNVNILRHIFSCITGSDIKLINN